MGSPPLHDDVHAWLTESVRRLGADGGCFHLKSLIGERIVCQAITDSYAATHLAYSLDLTACGAVREVLETDQMVAVERAETDSRVVPLATRRFGLKSLLYCPVHLRGLPDAVAIFSHREQHHRWSTAELEVASALCSQIEASFEASQPDGAASSRAELMWKAVPGVVSIVNRHLLTEATTGEVRLGRDGAIRGIETSVVELLGASDRGHEFRAALNQILGGERDLFQALLRTARGAWWIHARYARRSAAEGGAVAVVHVQPMPAATRDVLVEEERRRLEALGRIAGSVAHEVNNVLQHIGLGIEEIEVKEDDRETLGVIRSSLARAARVTHQMLTFARRSPSQFENRELTEFLQEELDLARRSVGADHRVTLRLGRRASVKVDVRTLQLVLINLCRNAADVSPSGAEIVIEGGGQNIGGVERAVFAVIDGGPGIPDEVRENLGALQTSAKQGELGFGIGLSVVKQVADEHGAEVVIGPGDGGKGSRVALHLPLVGVPSRLTRAPSGPRVLVVDDELQLTRMIARILGTRGYQTKQCSSLAGAIETFDHDPDWPDLLIFDINLGDGSGLDLYEHIDKARCDVRCLAISGFVDLSSTPVLADGRCAILAKPFTPSDLLMRVAEVLEG